MKSEGRFGTEFESQASEKGLLGELCEFLLQSKKYWMIPIIVALLVAGTLILLSSTAVTPFIYTLF
jgi:hypothetical protein